MAMDGPHYPPVSEPRSEQPLKLFVGQVPKDMDEDQLRPLFEQAGPIAHIMVIRDRQTDAHRGCAFLTYQTREAGERAVDKFHNKVKLPNAHNPVQVRPADSQMGDDRLGPNARVAPVDRENKLFVGMLPHDADDMTLTEVFSGFGEITEIYCMRNPDGTPKGCAFVKFSTRSAAISAIEALHEKCTMEGATRALVVKFADVKKTHTAKGWLVPEGRGPSPIGYNGVRQGNPANYWQPTAPPSGGGGGGGPRDVYPKGRDVYAAPYPYPAGYPPAHLGPAYPTHPYEYQQRPHGQGGYSPYPPSSYNTPYGPPVDRPLTPPSVAGEHTAPFSSPPGGPMPLPRDHREMGRDVNSRDQGGGTRPQEGPPGANLFIYHLPNDLTDADLATAFAPFGHVVSAKVFLDKRTGESKGFGFVSYEHPNQAEVAIGKMNGFQIGSKRLKVQHKKADHGERDPDGSRYPHHGREMQQQHVAPLHGGPGRLGIGYPHPPTHAPSSPELRGYHSHPSDSSRIMYTGGGDTRTIYAGPIPNSSYSAGLPDENNSGGVGNYRVKTMGHGPSGGGAGGGGGNGGMDGGDGGGGAPPGGGGLYHTEGGGDEGL